MMNERDSMDKDLLLLMRVPVQAGATPNSRHNLRIWRFSFCAQMKMARGVWRVTMRCPIA